MLRNRYIQIVIMLSCFKLDLLALMCSLLFNPWTSTSAVCCPKLCVSNTGAVYRGKETGSANLTLIYRCVIGSQSASAIESLGVCRLNNLNIIRGFNIHKTLYSIHFLILSDFFRGVCFDFLSCTWSFFFDNFLAIHLYN